MKPLGVVVQPSQAWRIDWRALVEAAPARDWALITNEESARELGNVPLTWIHASPAFDAHTVASIIHGRSGGGPDVRLVTGHETAVRPCAHVRQALGLCGPDEATVARFLDKRVMKRAMAARHPECISAWREHDPARAARDPAGYVDAVIAELGLPVFAKPVEDVGSAGTARLDDRDALAAWCAMPRDVSFELDAFLDGPVYNADALVVGGRMVWFGACELLHPPAAVLTGATLASWTLSPADPAFAALRAVCLAAIDALAPPDGAIHLEAVSTREGMRFLEVACRNAGWLISEAYRAAGGPDLRVLHLVAAAAEPLPALATSTRAAGYYLAIQTREGRIGRRLDPPCAVPHVVTHRAGPGRGVRACAILLSEIVCELVAWHDDHASLRAALRELDGFVPYELRPK